MGDYNRGAGESESRISFRVKPNLYRKFVSGLITAVTMGPTIGDKQRNDCVMAPQQPIHRPKVHEQHWRSGVLHLRDTARARLYWTPDPQHSPVLRVLHGGEAVDFVPEIKFGHWVIVRLGHQLGWVTLETVEIVEDAPSMVDPAQFLDEDETAPAAPPPQRQADIEETMAARPRALDARIRANMEHEAPAPPPPATGGKVSTGDLRRLIRFVTGKLTGARNPDGPH